MSEKLPNSRPPTYDNPEQYNPELTRGDSMLQGEQTPSPAERIGLVDGEFVVRRSSGQEETGWSVNRVVEQVVEGGAARCIAILNKTELAPDGSGPQTATKAVPLEALQSWQVSAATESHVNGNHDQDRAESRESLRLKSLFQPLSRPEPVEDPDYDILIRAVVEDDPKVQEAANAYRQELDKAEPLQREYDKFVSEATIKLSAEYLERALETDSQLAELIGSLKADFGLNDPVSVVNAIRTNPDMRLAVGKYMLDKINLFAEKHPDDLPDRVRCNGEKAPKGLIAEYIKTRISSREYVALLCLAKLDGSFNGLMADDIEIGSDGNVIVGQHRVAADMILNEPAG